MNNLIFSQQVPQQYRPSPSDVLGGVSNSASMAQLQPNISPLSPFNFNLNMNLNPMQLQPNTHPLQLQIQNLQALFGANFGLNNPNLNFQQLQSLQALDPLQFQTWQLQYLANALNQTNHNQAFYQQPQAQQSAPQAPLQTPFSEQEEVILVGCIAEMFFAHGTTSVLCKRSGIDKMWTDIHMLFNKQMDFAASLGPNMARVRRSASELRTHYRQIKTVYREAGRFKQLFANYNSDYAGKNIDDSIKKIREDTVNDFYKLVINELNTRRNPTDNEDLSNMLQKLEDTTLVAAVLEYLLQRGSFSSNKVDCQSCWRRIKLFYDSYMQAIRTRLEVANSTTDLVVNGVSAGVTNTKHLARDRSTQALCERFNIIKQDMKSIVPTSVVPKNLKVYYLAFNKLVAALREVSLDIASSNSKLGSGLNEVNSLSPEKIYSCNQSECSKGSNMDVLVQGILISEDETPIETDRTRNFSVPKQLEESSIAKANAHSLEEAMSIFGAGKRQRSVLDEAKCILKLHNNPNLTYDEVMLEEENRLAKRLKCIKETKALSSYAGSVASDENENECIINMHLKQKRTKWTKEDLGILWESIALHGNEWQKVRKSLMNRTYHQVKDKGKRLLHERGWQTGRSKSYNDKACEDAKTIARMYLTLNQGIS